MSDDNRLSGRIDALEARIAYQEDTIETLNQTVTAQWQQIDALRRLVSELGDRLRDAESNSRGAPANEPPPHY
ncbi:MAG: SlyX family protein [Xanthobacteraceae bacterium]